LNRSQTATLALPLLPSVHPLWDPATALKLLYERLPDLVQPWARVSNRLLEELKAIGLSASAEVSERLAPRLGMKVKAPTLLCYMRSMYFAK
jgi:hypothetical protein